MILQNRNDLFRVEIPKIFIPDNIKKRYEPYIFRMPVPIKDVSDLVNWSIQSITVPTISYDPIEQTKAGYSDKAHGTKRLYRESKDAELLIDRKFTITFQLLDGNVNYWILLETFLHYYNFNNKIPFTSNIPVRILDAEGINLYSVIFKDCLFTGLSDFTLSYSELTPEFRTFEANFAFNELQMDFQAQ